MIEFETNPSPSFNLDVKSPLHNAFERKAIVLDLREGAIIFHPDQKQDSLYFVKSGVLRSLVNRGDTELTRWFYSAGDLAFSALCFLHGAPSDICLEAACPSVIMQIYREDYNALCNDFPEFKKIVNDLQTAFLSRYSLHNDSVKMLSRIERYRKFLAEFPTVNHRVKVMHLASFLGMSPDTLSRIRRQFKDESSKNNPTAPSNCG
ncbi:Crp/Fnr family transcriptional regulator [Dyadobacter arcticus]|uniref:CRP-like cAMP-binding protein n=1 Tax=Dyadobacter arcticus TaxID=1078754 RepID=A0ABX0UDR7_9BACT|nr:Crp/Fnr family transcriptional regulator [Dyadobacter arcticus]NIJ51131.1 CRP-like cAMP-binding protein [Dyadobacter arcticus]